jgi:transcriptional regulator with XRE-family HTH domain
MPFGKTLKAARIKAGLSLRKLGEAVGYPFSALSEIENGTRGMPGDMAVLAKITNILGISLSEAKREIEMDETRREPSRLENIFRNNEEFAAEFCRETDPLSDEELLAVLRGALGLARAMERASGPD